MARRLSDTERVELEQRRETCPICGSEAEEIDQGTFDGTAFRCKKMARLRLLTTRCSKTAGPALSSGSVRSKSLGPEPPLQVAAPAFSPLTSLKTNRLRRALGVEVAGFAVFPERSASRVMATY
jgi:hypothetical protein